MTNTTNKTQTCQITIDVTAWGYTPLLQLLETLDDFSEDDDNELAADYLRDWIMTNARKFLADARDARDFPAVDLFESFAEEEDAKELGLEEEPETEEGLDAYLADAIQIWRDKPENADLDNLLEQNAIDIKNGAGNLFREGVFHGLAEAVKIQLRWATDDEHELERAIYTAYGLDW